MRRSWRGELTVRSWELRGWQHVRRAGIWNLRLIRKRRLLTSNALLRPTDNYSVMIPKLYKAKPKGYPISLCWNLKTDVLSGNLKYAKFGENQGNEIAFTHISDVKLTKKRKHKKRKRHENISLTMFSCAQSINISFTLKILCEGVFLRGNVYRIKHKITVASI